MAKVRTPKFEQAKLKRLLSTQGKSYTFERLKRNQFGELVNPPEVAQQFVIVGIYHEWAQHVQEQVQSETRYRTEKRPLILSEYAKASQLQVDDQVEFGGAKYKVVAVRNVNALGIYGDISLEVIDNGGRV